MPLFAIIKKKTIFQKNHFSGLPLTLIKNHEILPTVFLYQMNPICGWRAEIKPRVISTPM